MKRLARFAFFTGEKRLELAEKINQADIYRIKKKKEKSSPG